MAERVGNGKSPFVADKKHMHHKLMQLGLFHSEAVFVLYMLQAVLVTAAFILRFHYEWFLLLIYLAFAGCLTTFFYAAAKSGWRLERPGAFDRLVKIHLKTHVKDQWVMIKLSMGVLDLGLPLLLIATCVLPADIPAPMTWTAAGLALVVPAACLFKPDRAGIVLRAVIYFFLPLVLYYGEVKPAGWIPNGANRWFISSLGVLVFFAVMTLKFTRRREGFKLKPIDFIILFVAVVVPNLPDAAIRTYHAGPLAAKIVVLFFVFEVLAGELRGALGRLGFATAVALALVAVKGFL